MIVAITVEATATVVLLLVDSIFNMVNLFLFLSRFESTSLYYAHLC